MDAHSAVVAVVGAAAIEEPRLAELARAVGFELARAGCSLLCGGLGGIMEEACRGLREARDGGVAPPHVRAIGLLPGARAADANRYVDISLPTGMGMTRNSLVARGGAALIAVNGGAGTLSEIAYAWQYGKPIVVLSSSGGWAARLAGATLDQRRDDPIQHSDDPAEAVRLCLASIR